MHEYHRTSQQVLDLTTSPPLVSEYCFTLIPILGLIKNTYLAFTQFTTDPALAFESPMTEVAYLSLRERAVNDAKKRIEKKIEHEQVSLKAHPAAFGLGVLHFPAS